MGDELVGVVKSDDAQVYSVHADQVGRPELVTSASGANVWRASNNPFERIVSLDNFGGLNIGSAGQYFDVESGLWHNGHRDYDPTLGRFIQPDPLGLDGEQVSLYAFAGSNPVSYVDPDGRQRRSPSNGRYIPQNMREIRPRPDTKHEVSGRELKEKLEDYDTYLELSCALGDCTKKEIRETVIPGHPLVCVCGPNGAPLSCPAVEPVSSHMVGPPGLNPKNSPYCSCRRKDGKG